jgi:type I restriction enzyme S subunit
MEFFKVSAPRLTERLDPGHYRPTLIENEEKIRRLGSERLSTQYYDSGIGHTAAVTPHYTSDSSGIPFISGGCIIDGHLDLENAEKITSLAHSSIMGGSKLEPGFILLVRKGELGNSAVVPEGVEVNCSSEVVFLKPKPEADSHFVSAHLNSRHGRMTFLRQQRGMMITSISLYDVPEIPILKSDPSAKKYIGDKVRQSERLRAWAKMRGEAIAALASNEAMKSACATTERQHNRPQLEDLSHRLDPKYYGNRAVAVFRQAKALGIPLSSLVKEIANGFEERIFFNEGRDYITVTEVSSGRLDLSSAPKIAHATEVPDKAIINEHCALVVRTGSIGTAVKVDSRDRGAVISSHLIRLEFADEADAAAVASYLCSPAGKILQHKMSYGAVQPQIGQDELLALPIPQFVLDAKEQILTLVTEQESAIRASRSLTTTAKYIVEALIEGLLTEAELIAAEQALQSGNDQLDRRLLNRLRADGVDGQGLALFGDLDELYDLLNQAEGV